MFARVRWEASHDGKHLAPALLADIRGLIEEARAAVAATINAGLTLLYWRIGQRINDEVLQSERAAYGREIVATLAQELTAPTAADSPIHPSLECRRLQRPFPTRRLLLRWRNN